MASGRTIEVDTAHRGGFWLRAVAYLIDSFIVALPTVLLSEAARVVFGETRGVWAGFLLTGFFGFFYFGLIQAQFEGTLGKKALGLTLVSETLERLTLKQTTVRFIMSRFSGLALGLGYFWVGWDEKKQGWHDKVAKTLVLRRDFVLKARSRGGARVYRIPPPPPRARAA